MPPARRASLRDSRRAGIAQNRRVDVKDIGFLKGAGIEYDEVGFSEIAIDAVKDTEDIFVIRDVGSIRTNVATSFGLDQVSQPRFVTSDRCDLHVLCRETPCQGPAKTGAYTGDDRRFARWHFQISPFTRMVAEKGEEREAAQPGTAASAADPSEDLLLPRPGIDQHPEDHQV